MGNTWCQKVHGQEPISILKRVLIYSRPEVKREIVKFFWGWGIDERVEREKTISNRGNRMCKSLETRELEVLYDWGTEKTQCILRLKTSLFFQGSIWVGGR